MQSGSRSIIIPLFKSSTSNRVTILPFPPPPAPPLPFTPPPLPPPPPFTQDLTKYVWLVSKWYVAKGILGLLIFPPENPSPGIMKTHQHTNKDFLLLIKNKTKQISKTSRQRHGSRPSSREEVQWIWSPRSLTYLPLILLPSEWQKNSKLKLLGKCIWVTTAVPRRCWPSWKKTHQILAKQRQT